MIISSKGKGEEYRFGRVSDSKNGASADGKRDFHAAIITREAVNTLIRVHRVALMKYL